MAFASLIQFVVRQKRTGTFRTSIGDAVPGNLARNLPAVRQTKTYRRAETLQVVAHVFVTACRWQCEIARGGSEKAPALVVDPERKITAVERVSRDRREETCFTAPCGSDEIELVISGNHAGRPVLSEDGRNNQETDQKNKPMSETEQITPPKTFARYPSAAYNPRALTNPMPKSSTENAVNASTS